MFYLKRCYCLRSIPHCIVGEIAKKGDWAGPGHLCLAHQSLVKDHASSRWLYWHFVGMLFYLCGDWSFEPRFVVSSKELMSVDRHRVACRL